MKSLYTEKSYSLARKGLGKFYHLFSHHNNQSLTFINSNSKSNLTISRPEIQNAIITVSDYAKNQVHIKLSFSSSMIPKVDYNANFKNDTCFICPGFPGRLLRNFKRCSRNPGWFQQWGEFD